MSEPPEEDEYPEEEETPQRTTSTSRVQGSREVEESRTRTVSVRTTQQPPPVSVTSVSSRPLTRSQKQIQITTSGVKGPEDIIIGELTVEEKLSSRIDELEIRMNRIHQQYFGTLVRFMAIDKISVTIPGAPTIWYPLITKDEFFASGNDIIRFDIVKSDINIRSAIQTAQELGFKFISNISRQELHPFKETYQVIIFVLRNGAQFVTYGQILGNPLQIVF